jgi:hypothetical protein
LDTEQLSEIIAQVLKKLNMEGIKKDENNKVLVIIEDAQSSSSFISENELLAEAATFSILTDRYNSVKLKAVPAERVLILEELPRDINVWLRQFEKILLPNPTLKIISKLAHIIVDDSITEIIFDALQQGKPVFMGQLTDETDHKLTKALRAEIERLNNKLRDYGIQQLSNNNLQCCSVQKNAVNKIKNVITLQDVTCIKDSENELSVSKNTLITPLAMDYLREKKISLIRMD